jgi:hypothetical protein
LAGLRHRRRRDLHPRRAPPRPHQWPPPAALPEYGHLHRATPPPMLMRFVSGESMWYWANGIFVIMSTNCMGNLVT